MKLVYLLYNKTEQKYIGPFKTPKIFSSFSSAEAYLMSLESQVLKTESSEYFLVQDSTNDSISEIYIHEIEVEK